MLGVPCRQTDLAQAEALYKAKLQQSFTLVDVVPRDGDCLVRNAVNSIGAGFLTPFNLRLADCVLSQLRTERKQPSGSWNTCSVVSNMPPYRQSSRLSCASSCGLRAPLALSSLALCGLFSAVYQRRRGRWQQRRSCVCKEVGCVAACNQAAAAVPQARLQRRRRWIL